MQVDFLFRFQKIVNGKFLFGVGEEVIVKDFNMLAVRIKPNWFYGAYTSFFVVNEAERAMPDATTRKKLNGEVILRIKRVIHPC